MIGLVLADNEIPVCVVLGITVGVVDLDAAWQAAPKGPLCDQHMVTDPSAPWDLSAGIARPFAPPGPLPFRCHSNHISMSGVW